MAGDELDDELDYEFDDSVDVDDLPTEEQLLEGAESDSDEEVEVKDTKDTKDTNSSSSKKRKRKNEKTEKSIQKKKQKAELMAEQKSQIALYPVDMLIDYMSNKVRSKNPDLSTLEVDEKVPSKDQLSELLFKGDHNDEGLVKFVEKFKPTLEKEKFVMILCMSAIRACDVMRLLRPIPGGCLKLIKKNKLQYDKKALTVGKTFLAASTAGRLKKLSDDGILDLSRVGAFIIDSSFLDAKTHSVWDIDEFVPTVKHLVDNSSAKVYIF